MRATKGRKLWRTMITQMTHRDQDQLDDFITPLLYHFESSFESLVYVLFHIGQSSFFFSSKLIVQICGQQYFLHIHPFTGPILLIVSLVFMHLIRLSHPYEMCFFHFIFFNRICFQYSKLVQSMIWSIHYFVVELIFLFVYHEYCIFCDSKS